jgi:hypothetical protein
MNGSIQALVPTETSSRTDHRINNIPVDLLCGGVAHDKACSIVNSAGSTPSTNQMESLVGTGSGGANEVEGCLDKSRQMTYGLTVAEVMTAIRTRQSHRHRI